MKIARLIATMAALAGILAGAAAPSFAAIGDSSLSSSNGKLTRKDRVMALDLPGINCDGLRDDRVAINAAVNSGGAAYGKTLDMSGCLAMLSSPGAGNCAITLGASTRIVGDKGVRTGFVLARHYCSGGTTPGGACDATSDCQGGGSCVYDLDSTGSQLASEFAPADGSTYKVICSASGSPGVKGVRIYGNQRSMNLSIMGGDDTAYGYCDGGTSNTEVCNSKCSTGGLVGWLCNTDADCSGGTCGNRQCNIDGGTCRAWAVTQKGGASGPGTIRAIDFDSATLGTIDDVMIHDVRNSDYLVMSGGAGSISRVTTTWASDPNVFTLLSLPHNAVVDTAIQAKNGSVVTDSRVSAWRYCYYLLGDGSGNYHGATAIGNTCGALGGATVTGWPGTTGFYLTGVGSNAIANRVTSGLICGASGPGSNIQNFIRNSCDLIPILFQVNGTHTSVFDNRNAWVTQGPGIAFNEMRGLCSGGSTRAGKLCLRKAPTSDTGLGCPSGTCDVDTSLLADAGAGHFSIMRNFLHQTGGAWQAEIAVEGSKRCAGGANIFKYCTVAGDCPASSCGSVSLTDGQISDNFFYGLQAGNTAIDLTSTGYNTSGVTGVLIANNVFQGSTGSAIKMPATASQASGNRIVGNLMPSTLTPVTNWDEGMGWADVKGVIADLPAAGCVGATGYTYWDLPAANAPATGCLTSTNVTRGTLDFDDTATESAQNSIMVPHSWSGALYADIYWSAAATTGKVAWDVRVVCIAPGEDEDGGGFNAASEVSTTVDGQTLDYNLSTVTVATLTGCAADEVMHIKLYRDGPDGTNDTMTGDARLLRVVLRQ